MAPVLEEVVLADEPATWEALGFTVLDSVVWVNGVALRLTGRGAGDGIVGWRLGDGAAAPTKVEHPNGAVALDHVVMFTDDLERTMAELAADGLEPRRVREVPESEVRQAFYVLGPALLELAGPVEDPDRLGFWGLVIVVADLDALAERLGDRLGSPREAVQPGRRIATLRPEAGSSTAVAFMTPR